MSDFEGLHSQVLAVSCDPVSSEFVIENAVRVRYFAVGPKIGDERISDAAEPFAPSFFGRDRVTGNSQNLTV